MAEVEKLSGSESPLEVGLKINEIIENGVGGTGLQMFDTVLKDHILTYEESKGLALQGTYVYKEAIAGSRYGYPDFYAKCLEEYQNSTEQFITDDWIQPLNPSGITGSSGLTNPQDAFDNNTSTYAIFASQSDYIEWDLGQELLVNGFTARGRWVSGQITSSNLAIYSVDNNGNEKLLGSSSGASNSGNYTLTCNFEPIICNKLRFKPSSNLSGYRCAMDEIDLIANKFLVVQKNSNGHIFYDISLKNQIDEIFTSTGMAWMYGIDQENERIFLPRNNWFEQIGDVSEVGQSVEAGLPNHWHKLVNSDNSTNNMAGNTGYLNYRSDFGGGDYKYNLAATSTYPVNGKTGNASDSNSIYGNSETVQPNAVKKLLYICVGNTTNSKGVTDIVNQGMDILEQVNSGLESRVKLDGSNAKFPYIVETYHDRSVWYRVWSDNWCEQGGMIANNTRYYFLKPYNNLDYTLQLQVVGSGNYASTVLDESSDGTSFLAGNNLGWSMHWRACGYIS